MDITVRVPPELEDSLERIVEDLYEGDKDRMARDMVKRFVESQRKRLSTGMKFEESLRKQKLRSEKGDSLLQEQMGDAFRRMQERKKKIKIFGPTDD